MRHLLPLLPLALALLPLAAASPLLPDLSDVEREFSAFAERFGRSYASGSERAFRLAAFNATLHRIHAHNQRFLRGESSYFRGVNQFSDLTNAEFKARFFPMAAQHRRAAATVALPPVADNTTTVDWRKKNAVTPVKDQVRLSRRGQNKKNKKIIIKKQKNQKKTRAGF